MAASMGAIPVVVGTFPTVIGFAAAPRPLSLLPTATTATRRVWRCRASGDAGGTSHHHHPNAAPPSAPPSSPSPATPSSSTSSAPGPGEKKRVRASKPAVSPPPPAGSRAPRLPPARKPVPRPAGGDAAAEQLGVASSAGGKPVVNAAIMQAMSEYFGDDGRELDEYLKRPRNDAGEVMLRVLLIGSGPAEVATAKVLEASDRVCGVYYCPDVPDVCDFQMENIANSSSVGAYAGAEAMLRFCKWARVDVVFVGPERAVCAGAEAEPLFAAQGITLFPHDVSAAIADGSLSVVNCFAALSEELDRTGGQGDQLVE
jgi:Phosphoribosylglycinamide synthetase, N domain